MRSLSSCLRATRMWRSRSARVNSKRCARPHPHRDRVRIGSRRSGRTRPRCAPPTPEVPTIPCPGWLSARRSTPCSPGPAFLATINNGLLGSCATGSTSFKRSKSNPASPVPEDAYITAGRCAGDPAKTDRTTRADNVFFSTGVPMIPRIRWPCMRAITPLGPPAAYGTMIAIGSAG